MDVHSIPTPPTEEALHHMPHSPASSRRSTTTGSVKSVKPINRISKRASAHSPSHDHAAFHAQMHLDSRHKRVWKACERCRMKKTKCDGEFPCKRCKDDGLVCTAGTRKKTEYKQMPRGYAEVLENTQLALSATVHKLYAMVRNGQPWELGEPELNNRGQPVIHNIAQKLGCIRPQNDQDLPVSHIFPEDESGLNELAVALEKHHKERDTTSASPPSPESDKQRQQQTSPVSTTVSSPQVQNADRLTIKQSQRRERSSSSELEYSDLETDYRKAVFGRMNPSQQSHNGTPPSCSSSIVSSAALPTLSPQSLTYDLDVHSACSDLDSVPGTLPAASAPLFPTAGAAASPVAGSYPAATAALTSASVWAASRVRPVSMEFTPEQVIQLTSEMNGGAAAGCPPPAGDDGLMIDVDDMLNQGLLESEFGRLRPHVLSCPNPEVMMGVGDPMIFGGGGFEGESLRM